MYSEQIKELMDLKNELNQSEDNQKNINNIIYSIKEKIIATVEEDDKDEVEAIALEQDEYSTTLDIEYLRKVVENDDAFLAKLESEEEGLLLLEYIHNEDYKYLYRVGIEYYELTKDSVTETINKLIEYLEN